MKYNKRYLTPCLVILLCFLLTACKHEHQYSEATCTEPATCQKCEETIGEPLGHDYSEATCTEPGICSRCGEIKGEALGHDYKEATCTEPSLCSRCGEAKGEPLGHSALEATCTEDSICDVCGEIVSPALGHDFAPATCTLPETCTRCEETQGEPLEHEFAPATCSLPETCTLCGETKGKPKGHKQQQTNCEVSVTCRDCGELLFPIREHEFTEATCMEPAHCLHCKQTQGEALGHSYIESSSYLTGDIMNIVFTCSKCNDSYTNQHKLSVTPITPDSTSNNPTEAEVYDILVSFKSSYPEGMHWTNDDYYEWKGGIFSGGYGCAGFAFILSDAAFGNNPARMEYDINAIRVGDILRINNNTHSVIVLAINGDTITIAEGNYNDSIHWGRTLSKSSVPYDYTLTRYPQ